MTNAVVFDHVSKRYPRGGTEGARYASLRHDLSSIGKRVGARFRGRTAHEHGTLALEDVSFEVEEGESFALIGPNGAGKSTALKIVSRISYPTVGEVRLRGRVAALMEVGSGVHPELTGRENIWLYGQILGMKKRQIADRFDDIVDFSELGGSIDTPVKFFSSGMQLRLGFSIAAFLDPDIFVVDEALAVGDAGFQAKCVERMTDLVKQGHTLLFVSHNLLAIETLCTRRVFLTGGHVRSAGETRTVLTDYLRWLDEADADRRAQREAVGKGLAITNVTVRGLDGTERHVFESGEGAVVDLHITVTEPIDNCWISVGLSDGRPGALVLCSMMERRRGIDLAPGEHVVTCRLDSLPLSARTYEIWASIREQNANADLVDWTELSSLRIAQPEVPAGPGSLTLPLMAGPVRVPHDWVVDGLRSAG